MKVDLKLTIRAAVLYEKLSGKNFYKISGTEDILMLTYACFVTTNKSHMTFDSFTGLLNNKHFCQAIMDDYKAITAFNDQFKGEEENNKEPSTEEKKEEEEITLSDIAAMLIINNGLDAEYVYDKMQFYEIFDYFKWANKKYQSELEMQRLWTFLNVIPIYAFGGSNKLKTPDQLIKFPWEMEQQKNNLRDKKDFVKQMFASFKSHNEKQEEDVRGIDGTDGCQGPEKNQECLGQDARPGEGTGGEGCSDESGQ